jgi:thiamine pyrophosphokinase
MTRAIVLSNGVIHDLHVLRDRLDGWGEAFVVAADGGSRYAVALGLTITAVLGDLDSIDVLTRSILEKSGVPLFAYPVDKDEIDLELAMHYAVDHGATEIVVLGAIGGRVDMTMANMQLMLLPALADLNVEFWDGPQTARVLKSPGGEISGQVGDTVSLLPLGSDAYGITTHDLKYPLVDETLTMGIARGVSNVMEKARVRVDLREGVLLAVHIPGKA